MPTHDHSEQPKPPGTRPAEEGGPAVQLDLDVVIPGETEELGRTRKLEQILEAQTGILDVHVRQDSGRAELCIHYDPDRVTMSQVLAQVRSVGAEVSDRYLSRTWFVRGMDCAQCAYVVEHALKRVKGVLSANVAYGAERLVVEYDSKATSARRIESKVRAAGYQLERVTAGEAPAEHAHGGGLAPKIGMPLALLSGVLLGLGYLVETVLEVSSLWATVLYAGAVVAGGFFSVQGAFHSLRQRQADIESLMVLAAIGACILGAWFEGAFLLFLFSLGHALEHRAMGKARGAVAALGKLRPDKARVKRNGDITEVPVEELRLGDLVIVRSGDRLPIDGVIRSGESSLDQAVVTGESVPVAKGVGDTVFASTVNIDSMLEVEVTKLSSETLLSRIIDQVAEAEAQKSPTQLFVKRLERRFVPLVLLAAPLLSVALLLLGEGLTEAVMRGISLLVAASPCALAIATPAAVLSAVARAARSGVLFKGGAALEALGKASAMAFDKTGTLTAGKPRVVSISTASGVTEEEILGVAAGAEALSSHPIAKAIVDAARERDLAFSNPQSTTAVHGKGLRATVDGEAIALGSLSLFDADEIPAAIADSAKQRQSEGQTIVVVRRGPRFLGVLGVADTLRPEAKSALDALRKLGIERTIMLSGDNRDVAQAIAAKVGIDEARAPLMPEEKVEALREMAKQGSVAMVGDGVNDAPALAAASVGIAMGGAGSDVALETADVVLMSDDLSRLPFGVKLARTATRVIRQNLIVALGVSVILIGATIVGWVQISEAVLLHEGSTLVVVANGLRLLRFRG